MLTKNLRTHYMILQDGRQFPITTELYTAVREAKTSEKATSFFLMRDPDTQQVMFDGELRQIKEFKEITKKDNGINGWYCGFGNLHKLNDKCNCEEKYGVTEHKFRTKAYEIYGKYNLVTKIIDSKEVQKKEWYTMYFQDLKYVERNNIIELCK